jgi:tungstate transport system substrate-binding protein
MFLAHGRLSSVVHSLVLTASVVVASHCFAQGTTSGEKQEPQTVRCAVIGGLNESDFWPQLADRFQRATGHRAEIVTTGPKPVIAAAFKAGEADLIVMHAGDLMINLVVDGYGENPQPWARNDFVIVGPASDPAKINGEKDAVAALGKIIASKSKLLIHASNGASELMSDLLAAGELELDPQSTLSLPGDKHRQMLKRATAEQAYTIVGRIPFLNGKLDPGELQIMVQGDERLRRTFLVVVATGKPTEPRLAAARKLAAFLREPATQAWIAGFGQGKLDEKPLFFPVTLSRSEE